MRLVIPTELTAAVSDVLLENRGVTNVVVLPGASRAPIGDVVMADVARESADEVLEALLAVDVNQVGSLAVTDLLLAKGAAFEQAERRAPGHGDDAVIWSAMKQRAEADTQWTWMFFVFLALATQLAAIAALIDSAVLIVGAMVLGPEFGAIAAISYGLLFRRFGTVWQAIRLLVVGFALAIAITTVLAWFSHLIGIIDVDKLPVERPQTGFIFQPDRWSFIVALLAGAAGVLSLTAAKSAALVGAFISVTTVPAAGNLAVAIALGHMSEISGSVQQLSINVAGMVVAGYITLAIQRTAWRAVRQRSSARGSASWSVFRLVASG